MCLYCLVTAKERQTKTLLSGKSRLFIFALRCENLLFKNPASDIIKVLNFLTGGTHMAISYNKLWKLLIDRKMSKADLRRAAGIAPNTMTKLNRDEEVTLETLGKICQVLGANIGDIVDIVPDTSQGK